MSTGSSLSKANKAIVPILTVLLLLSLLLLIKDYYFNSSFYNPSANDESHIDSLLNKDSILKILGNAESPMMPRKSMNNNNNKNMERPNARYFDVNNCNDQGYYYTDINKCNCFSCFSGESCQNFDENCIIADNGGNPLLFEEYWRNQSNLATTTEAVYYRSPYQTMTVSKINLTTNVSANNNVATNVATNGARKNRNIVTGQTYDRHSGSRLSAGNGNSGLLFPYLVDTIGRLHDYIGNIANIGDKYVVIGDGCTELIGASMYACNKLYGSKKSKYDSNGKSYVYAKVPYYPGYTKSLIDLGYNLEFTSNASLNAKTNKIMEFVTYPNNPTNTLRTPTYDENDAMCTIYDQVYYWPSLVNLTTSNAPLNTKISLFSFSKITGHAGSRLGWALVDDYELASEMGAYIGAVQGSVSIDAQHRAFEVFNTLLSDSDSVDSEGQTLKQADLFFNWVRNQLNTRWNTLNGIFNSSNSSKFVQEANPGAFYAWIRCLDTSVTCQQQFENVGISPYDGTSFGADSNYVRLELVTATSVWNIVVQRLKALIL